MAKYKCSICGYIYDDAKEKVPFRELAEDWQCPLCGAPKAMFEEIKESSQVTDKLLDDNDPLATYLKEYKRDHEQEIIADIHQMARTGKGVLSAMGPTTLLSPWEQIVILGAQLARSPLLSSEKVSLKTTLGKKAQKPLVLACPFYISHMSFGALSREAKVALAKGAAHVKTAMCSGEGGILPVEQESSYRYIFEYVPNLYSVTDENLQAADAIEIKIGQGTKPGLGGHLPKEKVTKEIAQIRGKSEAQDIISPPCFSQLQTKEELKKLVKELKDRSLGRPIGVKLAAGHIEEDLAWVIFAEADFVTIDGRGGATGASPKVVRDATSVPTMYALRRARRYLDQQKSSLELVITGGLRSASDIFKALAMGADAVALATGPMIALGCDQYRICHTGKCPLGIATQDEALRKRLDIDLSSRRVANYLSALQQEVTTFCRLTGHASIQDVSLADLGCMSEEVSRYTDVQHVGLGDISL